MTPKQILDSFSETLMQDERILSLREQALLRSLLHHAGSASLEPETHAAVNATIAAAVGETVAQRAFAVLGGSIVERILESAGAGSTSFVGMQDAAISAKKPSDQPQPKPAPKPPAPGPEPEEMPVPSPPQPPTGSSTLRPMARNTSLVEDVGVD